MRLTRLITGLVVAAFVVGHFLNHSLGVVSIEAMDRMRAALAVWWHSPPGTVLLYGSLLTHFALALVSLYRRSTLRMPAWEATQLALGLAIPPLLIAHIVGTRLTWTLLDHHIDYERVVGTPLRRAALLAAPQAVVPERAAARLRRGAAAARARPRRLRQRGVLSVAERGERGRHAEVQRRPRRHEREGPRLDGRVAHGAGVGFLDRARRDAARTLAAHAHRRHLPGAPRLGPC